MPDDAFKALHPVGVDGPRWRDGYGPLLADPLGFLQRARETYGDLVALTEGLPVLSRMPDCAGCVAVFGAEHVERVLLNPALFGAPGVAAKRHALSPALRRLSSGLFSMVGARHRDHRRLLAPALGKDAARRYHDEIAASVAALVGAWSPGQELNLLEALRGLTDRALGRIMFDQSGDDARSIGALARRLLTLRRANASAGEDDAPRVRDALIEVGDALERALREQVRRARAARAPARAPGLFARLCALAGPDGRALSEDELVAHGNVLFQAASEPVAVALTWAALLLTQRDDAAQALARELAPLGVDDAPARFERLAATPVTDGILKETLRLLPPSAVLVRVTSRPARLGDHVLPARTELLLSPALEHRDPRVFPEPNAFRPDRWRTITPSRFAYLPFGAGARHCLGGQLALSIMKVTLIELGRRWSLELAPGQRVDWTINVTLMPKSQPRVVLRRPGAPLTSAPLTGSLRDLVQLP